MSAHAAFDALRDDALSRCRDSMRRFERFRLRLSLAVATLAVVAATATFLCRTAGLFD